MATALFAFMTVASLAAAIGCADHRAPEPFDESDTPSVGWVIMHGDKDSPDEEFDCQSNPPSECVVHASTSADQTLSKVHLYFHPTKSETTYSGVVHVGYFRNAETSPGIKPRVTVKPGKVGNHSVVGIVTDKPCTYMLTLDVTAVTKGGTEEHIREEVPIVVS